MKLVILSLIFLNSVNALAGLNDLNLTGNLKFELGRNYTQTKYSCKKVETLISGNALEEFKAEHEKALTQGRLANSSAVYICPIPGTGGRMNESIYLATKENGRPILVVANPFLDQIFEVDGYDIQTVWFTSAKAGQTDGVGKMLINPSIGQQEQ